MANKDADIAVVVNGDTSQLRSDLKRGAQSLKTFEDKANDVQKKLAKVALAGVAAGTALTTALYKNQSAIIDRLAKTADALGVTTENLQALRHMGELAGVAAEDLDKAMQRMSKGLGDAARKGGAAADAIEDIGLNVEDVLKLSADKQMEILAKALQNVENHTLKASIASDLFGRNGLRMLKVLNQLEDEGLKPTIDSIDAMGASLSRVDAQAVEDANDAVAKAQEAAAGLAKELTITLAPIVESVANAFTDWVKESGGLRNKLEELKPIFSGLVEVGKALVAVWAGQMIGAMAGYVAGTGKVIASNFALAKSMGVASVAAKGMRTALSLLGGPVGVIATVIASFVLFKTEAKEVVKVEKSLEDATYDLSQSFKDLSKVQAASQIIDLEKAMESTDKKITKAKEALDEFIKSGGAIARTDVFDFDLFDFNTDEAITKAKAFIETLESEYQAMNTRLGQLGLQAEFGNKIGESIDNETEIVEKSLNKQELKYKGYYERRQEAQREHNAKMLEDHKAALNETEEVERLSWQSRTMLAVDFASNMFGNISRLMDTENKKQFKIAKAANIAQATMDGITASVGAFKVGNQIGGPILGGAFATASAATSAAMIGKIASQQFGGGTQSMSVPTSNPATPQGANAGQTLTVQGLDSGAIFTGDAVADLADRLLDFQRDGGRVVLGA